MKFIAPMNLPSGMYIDKSGKITDTRINIMKLLKQYEERQKKEEEEEKEKLK